MANEEIVVKASSIETIDYALFDLIDNQLDLHTKTNGGFKKVPVLWISPERSLSLIHISEPTRPY